MEVGNRYHSNFFIFFICHIVKGGSCFYRTTQPKVTTHKCNVSNRIHVCEFHTTVTSSRCGTGNNKTLWRERARCHRPGVRDPDPWAERKESSTPSCSRSKRRREYDDAVGVKTRESFVIAGRKRSISPCVWKKNIRGFFSTPSTV